MAVVITISGKAEAGKDFCATYLKSMLEERKKKVLIIHYADYLKYICEKYFCWDGKKDTHGRTLLQYVGTDLIRRKKPDFWVDVVCNLIEVLKEQYDYIIIPDTRFPNEVEKMSSRFRAISVVVVRPDHKNSLTEEQLKHPSETALDNFIFDYILSASTGAENMKEAVSNFIQNYNL